MIVDTSAIIAILIDEPEAGIFEKMISANICAISAGSWVEVGVVIARNFDHVTVDQAEALCRTLRLEITPVTEAQARITHHAFRKYGQGSGSPAKLNFGDCFSYALAIARGEPLLFKGDDFSHTDVVPALPQRR